MAQKNDKKNDKKNWHQATQAARSGIDTDKSHGSVIPPLYLSSNYAFEGFDKPGVYDYTRSGNPTRDELGKALATLENGYHGVVTATGMGALHLVFQLLGKDDVLLAPHDCYGGTYRLLEASAKQNRFKVSFVDLSDPDILAEAFEQKPAMVLIETPSNPLMRITDIELVVRHAKKVGTVTVVDNTFLSPALQRPLDLGVDIVLHSTTKYLNGHGDVVGGAVVAKTKELHEKLKWWANCIGITGAPFDSYMTLRGLRTLIPRVEYQSKSAMEIAEFLTGHKAVEKVNYPGLATHWGHEIAKRQQTGFGAMMSFELKGNTEMVTAFLKAVSGDENKTFTLAESLGGFESLVAHPATMTHASMTAEARMRAGIGSTLIRLSIGVEHVDDLKSCLNEALNSVSGDI